MGRIYMIRHGKPETVWGQGSDNDPGLDGAGNAQARAASDALLAMAEPFRPSLVVSSPLRRCRETAAPFARALGVEARIDLLFGEILTPANVAHADRSAWLGTVFTGRWSDIVGDIDYEAWRAAIVAGLVASEGTAVFSHFVAINAAVSAVTGSDAVIAFRPDHASITTFEVRDGALHLLELGREAATGIL